MSAYLTIVSGAAEHPNNDYTLQHPEVLPGDELAFKTTIAFDETYPGFNALKIVSAKMKLIADRNPLIVGTDEIPLEDYSPSDKFILDSYDFVPAIAELLPDLTTPFQLNRNWKLPAENEKRTIDIRSYEDGTLFKYDFRFPALFRWEYWVFLPTASKDFYSARLPNGGRNNSWEHYQTSDYKLRYEYEIIVQDGSDTTVFLQQIEMDAHDYDSNSDWINKSVTTWAKNSEDIYVEIEDVDGNGLIFGDAYTKIVASFEKVTPFINDGNGDEAALIGGFIWLETFEKGGVPNRVRVSSYYDITPEAPFKSVDSSNRIKVTVDGQVVTMEILIDYTKLAPNQKFSIYARLFDTYPATIVGDVTTEFKTGDETYRSSSFSNRAFQAIVTQPIMTLDKTGKQCCFKLNVYAEEGEIQLHNDRTSIYRFGNAAVESIDFYLQKYQNGAWGNVASLSDGTYGAFFALGFYSDDFGNFYTGFLLNWQDVLLIIGEGQYRFRIEYTDVMSNVVQEYSNEEYCLRTYNELFVDGSVRIEMIQRGLRGNIFLTPQVDYGDGWYEQIRLNGILRFKNSSEKIENNQYGDTSHNALRPIINEQIPHLTLHLKAIPGYLDFYLSTNMKQSDECLITDYNKNNRHIFDHFPVVSDGDYTPKNNSGINELSTVDIPVKYGLNNLRNRNSD